MDTTVRTQGAKTTASINTASYNSQIKSDNNQKKVFSKRKNHRHHQQQHHQNHYQQNHLHRLQLQHHQRHYCYSTTLLLKYITILMIPWMIVEVVAAPPPPPHTTGAGAGAAVDNKLNGAATWPPMKHHDIWNDDKQEFKRSEKLEGAADDYEIYDDVATHHRNYMDVANKEDSIQTLRDIDWNLYLIKNSTTTKANANFKRQNRGEQEI